MENIYLPKLAEIKEIIQETSDTKTIRLTINSGSIDFLPGQFGEFSVIGEGESTFGFSSSPLRKEFFEFSFRASGRATTGINGLNPGDKLSFRGPYGNYFDTAKMKGKNLVFVGGGIGMAPVKSGSTSSAAERKHVRQTRDRWPTAFPLDVRGFQRAISCANARQWKRYGARGILSHAG